MRLFAELNEEGTEVIRYPVTLREARQGEGNFVAVVEMRKPEVWGHRVREGQPILEGGRWTQVWETHQAVSLKRAKQKVNLEAVWERKVAQVAEAEIEAAGGSVREARAARAARLRPALDAAMVALRRASSLDAVQTAHRALADAE